MSTLLRYSQSHSISCILIVWLQPGIKFQQGITLLIQDKPVQMTIPCDYVPSSASNHENHRSNQRELLKKLHKIQLWSNNYRLLLADGCIDRDLSSIQGTQVSAELIWVLMWMQGWKRTELWRRMVAKYNRELCSILPQISTYIHRILCHKICECHGNFEDTTPKVLKRTKFNFKFSLKNRQPHPKSI